MRPKVDETALVLGGLHPTEEFEPMVLDLLQAELGLRDCVPTGGPGDGGRDIHGIAHEGRRVVVQCRHHSSPTARVGDEEIRLLREAADRLGYDSAVLVTNTDLTAPAKERVLEYQEKGLDVTYIDGPALVLLVDKHDDIGLRWLRAQSFTIGSRRVIFDLVPVLMPDCYPLSVLPLAEVLRRLPALLGATEAERSDGGFRLALQLDGHPTELSISQRQPHELPDLAPAPALKVDFGTSLRPEVPVLEVSICRADGMADLRRIERRLAEGMARAAVASLAYFDETGPPNREWRGTVDEETGSALVRVWPPPWRQERSWLSIYRTPYRVPTFLDRFGEVGFVQVDDSYSYVCVGDLLEDEVAYGLYPGGRYGVPRTLPSEAVETLSLYSPKDDMAVQVFAPQPAPGSYIGHLRTLADLGDSRARQRLGEEDVLVSVSAADEWVLGTRVLRPLLLGERTVEATVALAASLPREPQGCEAVLRGACAEALASAGVSGSGPGTWQVEGRAVALDGEWVIVHVDWSPGDLRPADLYYRTATEVMGTIVAYLASALPSWQLRQSTKLYYLQHHETDFGDIVFPFGDEHRL